jgi:hypothetical protein
VTEFARIDHKRLGSQARAKDRVPASVRRGRRGPGHAILVRAEREVREDAKRPRRCSPTTRSFGRPAMAQQQDSRVAARVEVRRGCGSVGE